MARDCYVLIKAVDREKVPKGKIRKGDIISFEDVFAKKWSKLKRAWAEQEPLNPERYYREPRPIEEEKTIYQIIGPVKGF